MRVVVLAGGTSTERDVSFVTGSMVYKAIKKNGHQTVLLDVFYGYNDKIDGPVESLFDDTRDWSSNIASIGGTDPDLKAVIANRPDQSANYFGPHVVELCQKADIVFLALHGENGENGKIQAAFDLLGIKYTGTGYLSSALAMDKVLTKTLFGIRGVATPQYFVLSKKDYRKGVISNEMPKLPCVVKTACGGSSVGVYIVNTQEEYYDAVKKAFTYESEVIVEQYIKGREFSIGVVDGVAYPIIEIAPIQGFYDYKNKYQAGSAIETCPAELPEELASAMQRCAEAAYRALGLESYGRMDFMMNEQNEFFCLEANTLPGMTPTSLLPQEAGALGMSFEQLVQEIIEVSLKKYE